MWKTFLRTDGTDGKNAGIGEKKTGESPLFFLVFECRVKIYITKITNPDFSGER